MPGSYVEEARLLTAFAFAFALFAAPPSSALLVARTNTRPLRERGLEKRALAGDGQEETLNNGGFGGSCRVFFSSKLVVANVARGDDAHARAWCGLPAALPVCTTRRGRE